MTNKQKKMLKRIILATVLMIALHFVPVDGLVRFGLYMVPYLTSAELWHCLCHYCRQG